MENVPQERLTITLTLVGVIMLSLAPAAQQRRPARARALAAPEAPAASSTQTPEAPVATPSADGASGQPPATGVPTAEELGFPIYPNAKFLTSYDAGREQRYFLFGTNSDFEAMVRYYTVLLDERGDRVFDEPATHIFEIGRFREQTMAFQPGITIKDYTWNGSPGYLSPTTGTESERFRTIIQIVPAPPEQARR